MTSHKRPAGFTLLELVVVLAILAILTGMAVASFTAVEDQTRFDATTRLVEDVEISILGERSLRNANNQPLINGFVADMGRLPKALNRNGILQPAELWSAVLTESPLVVLEPFQLRVADSTNISSAYKISPIDTSAGIQTLTEITAPSDILNVVDSKVFLGSGWRGPYLHLGPGKETLLDSWGNAMELLRADNSAAALNDTVYGALSRGADYPTKGVSEGYAKDQFFNVLNGSDQFRGSVTVKVKTLSALSGSPGNPSVTVQLFAPDSDTGKLRCYRIEHEVATVANEDVTFVFPALASLSSVPTTVGTIGARVIRVFKGKTVSTSVSTSPLLNFTLMPGNNSFSLELP